MWLTKWITALAEFLTYIIFGDLPSEVPHLTPTRHPQAISSSLPSHAGSNSWIQPTFSIPTHCIVCHFTDMVATGDQRRFDVLRLEFCDTADCQWWKDEVMNITGADNCASFSAPRGCKVTCMYSTAPADRASIDKIVTQVC